MILFAWKEQSVAERIPYFCLTRNLIRPLGSTHNFTQSGWLILFTESSFRAAEIVGSRETLVLFHSFFVQDRRLTLCSSIATAASHHHEGSCLIYQPLTSILLDQGFPVEYELDELNTSNTGTTLRHPQNWLCRLRCKISLWRLATTLLGNIFWRHSRFSPKQPEPQTHGDFKRFCPQTTNTTFATLWQTYFPHTLNNALTYRCTFRSGC